ncbi:restriction endonuclease subunit S [Microcoleus sp. Pol12B5]|uniref:restriction endonuclease subunit S n=1 Tax=Microcoleus sp. Pol12B5 TaxID=3055396 RepID=UPI002FD57377
MKTLCLPISAFCKTGSGTTPSRNKYERYFNGSIPWVKSGELRESIITETEERVTEEALAETSLKIAPKGSVLVAMYGANVGRVGILGINATTNQAVCYLIPEKEKADSRYVFHALQQKLPEFISRSVGGAQPNISQQIIRATKILLPPLEEQKRIAEILDRAEELRSKRREAIAELDTLTQAIFLEMFGNPVTNPKGWQIKICKSICSRITVGIVVQPASYYQEYGVPALRSQNIKENSISTDNLVFFSQTDNETKLAKTRVKAGDVVLVRTGQPGTAAVIPEELDGVNAIDLLITTPCKDVVDSVYLCSFFNSAWGKKLVSSSQVGQIQKHLNVGILNNAQIICPPLPLQQEFARRAETVEKLKAAHRASLSELNALFASLQHRAFRGEL